MKIALLADVHANLPALQSVIQDAQSRGADEFWNLGDMVGYAPFPNETIVLLQKTCSENIVGNYDLKVLSEKRIVRMKDAGKDPDKVFSFEWTNKTLTSSARQWVESLPGELRVQKEGKVFLLTHGSPEGSEDGISFRTPASRLMAMAGKAKADVIVCAHTHRALERRAGETLFVNPGSVGRSFDGDPRASYALLEVGSESLQASFYRVEYSFDGLAAEMEKQAFSQRLVRSLLKARSLDDLDSDEAASPDVLLKAVLDLGKECRYEKEHAHQVTRLALKLFDELQTLHGFGLRERLCLQCAALLHDVGFVYGADGHHKSSRDIILRSEKIPLTLRERIIVALIARYHRKSLPEPKHKFYEDLSSFDREIVDRLSAILRVADGLDRSHQSLVKDLSANVSKEGVEILLRATASVDAECAFAKEKSDLFEKVFEKPCLFDLFKR